MATSTNKTATFGVKLIHKGVETPLHPEKLTVWCTLWAGGIIGPYFFKNDEGHNVIVNGDWYTAMITNFFIPELNNHNVQELWFQQDSATCHTARATIDLLKDTFGDRLISRFGPVNWPLRSCDLTPLDYFLWGYVKSLVYADKPQTLDHLEDNIRRVIADMRSQMLEKVIENWTSRLDYIRASRGNPMPEIIFKIDEAHFWLNGYVNKQNCHIWSEVNRQVYVETPLHPEKLTVWCALWAGGIIGPYFFKNDEGHNITVNGDRVVMKSLVLGYFSTPPNQKSEVIRLLARVLDFNQEEMEKAGIVVGRQNKQQESKGILSSIFGRFPKMSLEHRPHEHEKSFTTLFVQFLENESQPVVPMPFPIEKMTQDVTHNKFHHGKKSLLTQNQDSPRKSPLLLDIDSAFPSFTPVPAIEFSPAPTILKEVLQ
ncbi:thyroid receptor-interacting protein 11 [Trichonephila clavipes]|nr:thyroid receptor-interacting protein 11 [Trichonephila clavipes]